MTRRDETVTAKGRGARWTRALLRIAAGAIAAVIGLAGYAGSDAVNAAPGDKFLKLYNIHTNEKATIVFKHGDVYDRAGLAQLNNFLRDWRREMPTRMDPHLFDLIWDVYRQSGSSDFIHVVCGFRSPPTNSMLRRRSSGVAQNSLHMQGRAMDFYIPDVPLAKLREIGLRMQLGGVGFYPTSGAPFVHMDTGTVRHWPRMSREQLVRVFPNGNTLHIPTDGKPLPGYDQALAAYKSRVAAETNTAGLYAPGVSNGVKGAGQITVASAAVDEGDDEDDTAPAKPVAARVAAAAAAPVPAGAPLDVVPGPMAAPAPVATRPVGVAVASYASVPPPMPRLAPNRDYAAAAPALLKPPVPQAAPHPLLAAAAVPAPMPAAAPALKPIPAIMFSRDFDFDAAHGAGPAVPAALASAMAQRDMSKPASLPIPPTKVVATIDVSRPLRADAITTAVLRKNDEAEPSVPTLLAFAAAYDPAAEAPRPAAVRASAFAGVPIPALNPLRSRSAVAAAPVPAAPHPRRMSTPELTLTGLDTVGLKLWIASRSTREKPYALLTMPDFAAIPSLFEKPDITFAAGFAHAAYTNLRTDRFSGALVQPPPMVDLSTAPVVAAIR